MWIVSQPCLISDGPAASPYLPWDLPGGQGRPLALSGHSDALSAFRMKLQSLRRIWRSVTLLSSRPGTQLMHLRMSSERKEVRTQNLEKLLARCAHQVHLHLSITCSHVIARLRFRWPVHGLWQGTRQAGDRLDDHKFQMMLYSHHAKYVS
jgi:hypothetical protein